MTILPPGNILQYLYIKERLNKQNNVKSFLEIGSGNGYLSSDLLSLNLSGVGCDLNKSACLNNEKLNKEFINDNRYKIYNEDFLLKKFDQKFDIIISSMVIEHLDETVLDKFFHKMLELINDSGKIIILVPSSMKHWGIEDEIAGHVKRYERQDLVDLSLKWNLEIVDIAGLTYPLSNLFLRLSNYLIAKKESKIKNLSMSERTIYTGNREVKFKTLYPWYFKIILNQLTLFPFHFIQKIYRNNENCLVLYVEFIKR